MKTKQYIKICRGYTLSHLKCYDIGTFPVHMKYRQLCLTCLRFSLGRDVCCKSSYMSFKLTLLPYWFDIYRKIHAIQCFYVYPTYDEGRYNFWNYLGISFYYGFYIAYEVRRNYFSFLVSWLIKVMSMLA